MWGIPGVPELGGGHRSLDNHLFAGGESSHGIMSFWNIANRTHRGNLTAVFTVVIADSLQHESAYVNSETLCSTRVTLASSGCKAMKEGYLQGCKDRY